MRKKIWILGMVCVLAFAAITVTCDNSSSDSWAPVESLGQLNGTWHGDITYSVKLAEIIPSVLEALEIESVEELLGFIEYVTEDEDLAALVGGAINVNPTITIGVGASISINVDANETVATFSIPSVDASVALSTDSNVLTSAAWEAMKAVFGPILEELLAEAPPVDFSFNLDTPWKVAVSVAGLTMEDMEMPALDATDIAMVNMMLPFILEINSSSNKIRINIDPELYTVPELVEDLFDMDYDDLPEAAKSLIAEILSLTFYKQ